MVKRCSYGVCNSDSRYLERNHEDISFVPFPKPKTNLEKCKRWIRLCGRPHHQLNLSILFQHSKAKHRYVCSKHFVNGKPTVEHPDPLPATHYDAVTPARPPPKPRAATEPVKKKSRKVLENRLCCDENVNSTDVLRQITEEELNKQCSCTPSLDLLAMAAENKQLKDKLAAQVIVNGHLIRKLGECQKNTKSA